MDITLVTSPPYFPITADSYPLEQAETIILLQNDDLSLKESFNIIISY